MPVTPAATSGRQAQSAAQTQNQGTLVEAYEGMVAGGPKPQLTRGIPSSLAVSAGQQSCCRLRDGLRRKTITVEPVLSGTCKSEP